MTIFQCVIAIIIAWLVITIADAIITVFLSLLIFMVKLFS